MYGFAVIHALFTGNNENSKVKLSEIIKQLQQRDIKDEEKDKFVKKFQNDVSCCFITIFLSELKRSNVTPLEVKKVASKSLFYNDFFNVFFIFLILFDLFEIVNQI